MSEYHVQVLYAIFATAALALATRTVVADNFANKLWLQRKPFNCTYCLSFWWAVIVCMVAVDYINVQTSVMTVLVTHFLAYVATQKLT